MAEGEVIQLYYLFDKRTERPAVGKTGITLYNKAGAERAVRFLLRQWSEKKSGDDFPYQVRRCT